MGGDEFAVALIESGPDAADRFVSRLQDRIAGGDFPSGFAISAGQSHYPSEGESPTELFRVADGRLYEAKRDKSG
jgi:GGDEF domain-containing protein